MICRCGHVREDHVPMDIDSAQPCVFVLCKPINATEPTLCPCLRFEP